MENRQISKVTIVGGGTAGWLAACLLARIYRRVNGGPSLDISVIESPSIPTVGVGEATVPAMPRTLMQLGIDEREFFLRCNASFKLGVRFTNWNVDDQGQPIQFLNHFETGPRLHDHDLTAYYTKFGAGRNGPNPGPDFIECHSAVPRLIGEFRGPRQVGVDDFAAAVHYAYHLDAGLFAGLLKEKAEANGVTHIPDDLIDVELDDAGFIAAVQLKEGGRHPVELVIDCTGFRSLLLQKALGEPFESYDQYLMNDRALALQIPHDDVKRLVPCTGSTALGAGWVWRVPLYNRIGTGYVFSSKFRTDEEAIREFIDHIGPAAEDAEPRVIPLRIGHARRSWVKNCVAMGLASGFIEPLESTAIYSIEMAVRWLHTYFPDRDFDPSLANRYNMVVNDFYDELRDFIAMHFHLNNRTDSDYWIAAREAIDVPDSLRENLAVWRRNLPSPIDLKSRHLFDANVYTLMLLSKGFYRDQPVTNSLCLDSESWEQFIRDERDSIATIAEYMPSHYELVSSIRGETADQPAFGRSTATVPVPGSML
jgi:tryptophan halogenase